jgi:hypothetical protein
MNKIVFIDTNRNFRAKLPLEGGLRAFHRAPGAFRSALTCIWRVDPSSGRLVASWSLESVDDLTHCHCKSHFANRAAEIAPPARAA